MGADEVVQIVRQFNDAFNAHNVDAMMRLMSHDCVFENTFPPPDGTRFEGAESVRAFWEAFFAASPQASIEIEDLFSMEDRCIMRWVYRWGDGHVRGVDIYRLKNHQITEKLSYVKG